MIPEIGLHKNIPFRAYQQWDAVNPSLAKHARISMRHFKHARDLVPPDPPNDAMILGSATHCSVLEPDTFPQRFVLWDGGTRRGRAWDDFVAANAPKQPITASMYENCIGMRDSVHAHPVAAKVLKENPLIEASLVWRDDSSGVLCKGRPDMVGPRIGDLKTTRSINDRMLVNTISAFSYHISEGAYHDAIWRLTGEVKDVVLIFVENAPPFDVAVRTLASEAIQRGVEQWHELLAKIAECQQSGKWPGMSDEELPLGLPAYEYGSVEHMPITFGDELMEV